MIALCNVYRTRLLYSLRLSTTIVLKLSTSELVSALRPISVLIVTETIIRIATVKETLSVSNAMLATPFRLVLAVKPSIIRETFVCLQNTTETPTCP